MRAAIFGQLGDVAAFMSNILLRARDRAADVVRGAKAIAAVPLTTFGACGGDDDAGDATARSVRNRRGTD
jgi:hypothetical protein